MASKDLSIYRPVRYMTRPKRGQQVAVFATIQDELARDTVPGARRSLG